MPRMSRKKEMQKVKLIESIIAGAIGFGFAFVIYKGDLFTATLVGFIVALVYNFKDLGLRK